MSPLRGRHDVVVTGGALAGASTALLLLRERPDLRVEMGEAGRRNHGRRIRAFFDLGWSPWRMVLRATRLWTFAELDGARLALLRRPGRRPGSVGRATLAATPRATSSHAD